MPICHKKKLIFVHIPKNAGTYVEKYLNLINDNDASWFYYKKNYPTEWKEYKKICIVRDPITRFLSCCKYYLMRDLKRDCNIPYWKITGEDPPSDIHTTDLDVKPIYDDSIENHESIYKILNEKNINEFVDLIYKKEIILPINPWFPQTYFVCDKNNLITVDEVIKFESLNSNSIGINFKKYPPKNVSIVFKENIEKLKLDKKTFSKIIELYEIDFKNFNYKIPDVNIVEKLNKNFIYHQKPFYKYQ
jgi:hypothetical protein